MSRKLDDLIIGLQLQTKSLEQGMNEVKRQLRRHGNDVRKTGAEYDRLAVTASAAFYGITRAIKGGIDAYNSYNNSMVGLKSITQGTGNSFGQAQKFIEDFTRDGLIPAGDAATALKNLLARGFGMNEATDILNRFKDAAAFGRQGSLTLGEAVRSAAEGIKNENSVLVDNAGVTKNVSKMWEEYAKSIGKSTNDLTIAEKRQAEYNGIMKETQHQVGDAAKYSKELAGAQAKATAEGLKAKQAFGEALAPILRDILSLITPILSGITTFIKNNQGLVAAVTVLITIFTGLIAVTALLKSKFLALGPIIKALGASFSFLAAHPVILALMGIATVVGVVATKVQKAKQAQEAYNETLNETNKIKAEGIQVSELNKREEEIAQLRKLTEEYDQHIKKIEELRQRQKDLAQGNVNIDGRKSNEQDVIREDMATKILEQKEAVRQLDNQLKEMNHTYSSAKDRVDALAGAIDKANKLNLQGVQDEVQKYQSVNETNAKLLESIALYKELANKKSLNAKEAQELADTMQLLIDIFGEDIAIRNKEGDVIGLSIKALEREVAAVKASGKYHKDMTRQKIEEKRKELAAEIARVNGVIANIDREIAKWRDLYLERRRAVGPLDRADTDDAKAFQLARTRINALNQYKTESQKSVEDYKKALIDLAKLRTELDTAGSGTSKIGSNSSANSKTKSSTNEALQNALRVYEYKKHLDKLTLEDELRTLETIKAKYAKTAEEKMELEERIYDVRKAIADKNRQLEEDTLKRKNQDMLNILEDKKSAGELNVEEETKIYDRIINLHKDYLNKILTDEKITADEKRRIQQEEEDTVREYERRKAQIKQEYAEKDRQDAIGDINRMNGAIISALRNRYQEQQRMQEEALQNELKSLDSWKDASLKNIKDVYDIKIKSIQDAAKVQEDALRAEIEALDLGKKEKDRAEIDASELSKIQSVKDKLEYEHNEFNKVQLQKELNKLLEEREKRLYEQQLEDKKDSLSKQIEAVKENAEKQKEELEKAKENELNTITAIYDARKITLDRQLEDVRQFFANKLNQAALEAEAEKMLMDNNQKEILALLQSYGNEYEITGKTLGERLYDGFKPAIDGIKNMIASITASINEARDQALAVQAMASNIIIPMAYTPVPTPNKNTVANKPVEINQTNVFNMPIASPSAVARKNKQVLKEATIDWGL